jgi:hypothetical protein
MLLFGTFLVDRPAADDASFRVGVQWLASRAWFWTRMKDGRWVRSGSGPGSHTGGSGDGRSGDDPFDTGAREPRRPRPPSDAAARALPLPPG